MRNIKLLFAAALSLIAWTGVMAQTDAEYEAALAAIQENGVYYVKSDVGGTYYYLKGDGTLTATQADAAKFIFQKFPSNGGLKEFGFKLNNNGTFFSNPPGTNESNLANGSINTSTRTTDNQYEAQVFFLNTDGKYAIRAGNVPVATSGWAWVAGSYWTVVGDVDPIAQYQWEPNYCWELEIDETATQQVGALLTVQSWPFFMQSAVGLVKDFNKYTSNAKQATEGSYEALLDNEYTTFFHSCWSNGPDEDHYLQAELSKATQKFEFYFKKRSQNNNNRPTTIVISASNDGTTFTDITTLDSGFPTEESVIDYLSSVIDLGASYKYVRFTILNTNNGAENNGHKFFTFSEFYILPGVDAAAQVAEAYNQFSAARWSDLTPAQVSQINMYDTALKAAISTVNVTYEVYEADGTTLVASQTVVQQPGTEVEVPSTLLSGAKFYDYSVSDTNVGSTDCTIKIIRTLKAGFVGTLADLSNDKAYTISCDRGSFLTKDGYLASTAHSSLSSAEASQFAIINYEGYYYLYSVADSKFVKNDGGLVDEPTNGLEDAIIMEPKSVPYFLWHFNSTDKFINTNGGDPYGYVINYYSTPDPGNQYYMYEVGAFNPANAIAALDALYHPAYAVIYVVKDENGNTIFTSDPEPTELNATITTLPDKHKRNYYTYNTVNVPITSAGGTEAVFTATWTGPFEISADFATAHWYNMKIRSTWYVTSDNKDTDGALATVNANAYGLGNDPYHWAFLGNGYDGFKVINKAEGADKVYAWTEAANQNIPAFVDAATANTWDIKPSTASGYTNAFMLTIPSYGYQVNQFGGAGGSLKIWNSTGTADEGSAFNIMEIPTDYSEFVSSEIAPYFGTGSEYFVLNDAAKATIGYDPAYTTNCSYEAYKAMKDKLTPELIGDVTNYALPETGYYILKDKYYGTYMGIDPSDATLWGNYKSANAAKNIVNLIKTGADTYNISIMGKYAPTTVTQSQPVLGNTTAGTYKVFIPTPGYGSFMADPDAQYSALHCRAQGDLVGWTNDAEASLWQVMDAGSIQLTVGDAGYATTYLPFPVEIGKTLTIPAAKGAWTFDDGMNGTGVATMEASAGVTVADGVATVPAGDKLTMTTNLKVEDLESFTLMMDVLLTADKETDNSLSAYTSLFQNKPLNDDDGSLFIYWHKTYGRRVGINAGGLNYGSSIDLNTWYRITFVAENAIATVYVDGVKIGSATAAFAKSWILHPTVLFFADNDGEENEIKTSEIRFWDIALDEGEVSMLGAAGTEVPEPTGIAAYTGKITDSYLTLTEVENVIPALTGVVLKGDPGVYEFAVAADVAPIADNDLQGTLEPIDAAGLYILAKPDGQEVGFYEATSGKIAAGKAYIEYSGAGIKGFTFKDDDATGIANVEKAVEDGIIYNVAGQRLNKVQKGINIVNGKKILK